MVLSKDDLLDRVWRLSPRTASNVVDVYVGRLRSRLGAEVITTVRGEGYRADPGYRGSPSGERSGSAQRIRGSLMTRLWASRWPEAAWALFTAGNLAWMVLVPSQSLLPFLSSGSACCCYMAWATGPIPTR